MTNELLEEMLHSAPLSWGISPVIKDVVPIEWLDADEEIIPQCDLENPESCESCQ